MLTVQIDYAEGKVDHAPNGSKDCLDVVVGVCWYLTKDKALAAANNVLDKMLPTPPLTSQFMFPGRESAIDEAVAGWSRRDSGFGRFAGSADDSYEREMFEIEGQPMKTEAVLGDGQTNAASMPDETAGRSDNPRGGVRGRWTGESCVHRAPFLRLREQGKSVDETFARTRLARRRLPPGAPRTRAGCGRKPLYMCRP